MNIELFRKKVELKAELSKIEAKEKELNHLLKKEYFAEFKIEGRTLHDRESDDAFVASYRESQVGTVSQSCFSGATFGLWNDLCKRFLHDMKELLAIQKMSIDSELEEIG